MPAATPRFSRDFYLVTIANFVFFLNFASFFLLPLHLKSLGVSERTIGFVMGTGGFAGLCVMPFLGALLDRVSRRGFVTAGALAMALASYAYLLLHGAGGFIYVLRVVQGVSFTCAFVTASTLAVELAPASRRGEALGIFGISTLTTHAIAPALGEVIARRWGFPVLFTVAGTAHPCPGRRARDDRGNRAPLSAAQRDALARRCDDDRVRCRLRRGADLRADVRALDRPRARRTVLRVVYRRGGRGADRARRSLGSRRPPPRPPAVDRAPRRGGAGARLGALDGGAGDGRTPLRRRAGHGVPDGERA
ncbi:MAG: MFS transporter, partial [Deltaproteobacteria bacterium]